MGYIKEPEGVDLLINGGSLSDEDAKKVSAIILRYKTMPKLQKVAKARRLTPSSYRRKKELA